MRSSSGPAPHHHRACECFSRVSSTDPRQVRYVFSMTSDTAEWDREIAVMIASRRAEPGDGFVRVGWLKNRGVAQ